MGQFYYLVSSLPMLSHGEKPLISSEEFMASCSDILSDSQIHELGLLSLVPEEEISDSANVATTAWNNWETCLRNALVALRSKGKGVDSEKFLRHEFDFFSEIVNGAQDAFQKSTPLEMENALDKLRWSRLDNMEVGHMFDFHFLCIYKLKLMLCEKQNLLDKSRGSENFDKIIEHIYEQNMDGVI